MLPQKLNNVGVVILAAGRGTRLNCENEPKVMLQIGNRPIVSYIVATLKKIGFKKEQICLVVGFKKDKVIKYFGDSVSYATQADQKGTAHAAYIGMKSLPANINQVLVVNGDDSAFYRPETLINFIDEHLKNKVILSLFTTDVGSNTGKIVRHGDGQVEIIEKEYLTEEQKKITEISTGTFMFKRAWFEEIFPSMPLLRKLKEFGLPTALAIARDHHEKYQVVKMKNSQEWFGINTLEELDQANAAIKKYF
ncbi:MAG: sugar phosphate nucleotidyltransferase [Candidatus Magasanikbacteria bacterium]